MPKNNAPQHNTSQHYAQKLEFMRSILPYFSEGFVLKGSGALGLFYGLNRYARDLNFDSMSEHLNFMECLEAHKDFKRWRICEQRESETSFSVVIEYDLVEARDSLKIESSAIYSAFLRHNYLDVDNILGVKVYALRELIAMKKWAFGDKERIRDLYDLYFLLEHYPQYFDKNTLLDMYMQISYMEASTIEARLNADVAAGKIVFVDTSTKLDTAHFARNMLAKISQMLKGKAK